MIINKTIVTVTFMGIILVNTAYTSDIEPIYKDRNPQISYTQKNKNEIVKTLNKDREELNSSIDELELSMDELEKNLIELDKSIDEIGGRVKWFGESIEEFNKTPHEYKKVLGSPRYSLPITAKTTYNVDAGKTFNLFVSLKPSNYEKNGRACCWLF